MNDTVAQIVDLIKQGIDALVDFLALVWNWSFGEIYTIFQSDWQALPVWKMIVLGVVVVAIAFAIYKAARELWDAGVSLVKALVAMVFAFVTVLPYVVVAGVLAFGGGYVIKNVDLGGGDAVRQTDAPQ